MLLAAMSIVLRGEIRYSAAVETTSEALRKRGFVFSTSSFELCFAQAIR